MAVSRGGCNGLREDLQGCLPAESLSRAAIQFGGVNIELFLIELPQVRALGQVLAQQPDGVFVYWAMIGTMARRIACGIPATRPGPRPLVRINP